MTKNWSTVSTKVLERPRTVSKAVERLLFVLEDEDCLAIASSREDELIDFHFGLGAEIRNAFGLHEPGSELLVACGANVHPDDASGIIIRALWERLTLQGGND